VPCWKEDIPVIAPTSPSLKRKSGWIPGFYKGKKEDCGEWKYYSKNNWTYRAVSIASTSKLLTMEAANLEE
jgi:hypothetical protein